MTQPRHRSHPTDGLTAAQAVPRLTTDQAVEVPAGEVRAGGAAPALLRWAADQALASELAKGAGAALSGGAPAKQPQVTSGPRLGNQAAMASAGRSSRGHSTSRAG